MKPTLKHKVDFDFIRYANCWEDAEVLVKAFQPLGEGKKLLSVASAGDNSFMLLLLNPSLVVAADLNPVQLHLTALKIAAIRHFNREQALAFLGFTECSTRVQLFEQLKPLLKKETVEYWNDNIRGIKNGIVLQGKFERYFRFFSKRILPLIHSRKKVKQLFDTKTSEEQKNFYAKKWNNRRWKFFFKIFFSKQVMGKYGRDPEFLKQVNLAVSDYIYKKAERQLTDTSAQHNYMLHYQLTGNFNGQFPPYLQEENFSIIRERLDKIILFHGDVNEAVLQYGNFDGMNLSNIFEYMDVSTFAQAGWDLASSMNPGGLICYWNLMVPRRISEIMPDKIIYLEEKSTGLTAIDKAFFYTRFIIDQARPTKS